MSFLKSMWKINGKHKKLNEEMVLTSSLRDFVESPLDFHDEELTDDPVVFNLKYLGSTTMTSMSAEEEKHNKKLKFSKKSQVITTSAIKRVLTSSKSQKKLKEVTISISPKGIIAIDQLSDEKIVEVPIHRISYCSIDAAHDTIFSFVSSPESSEQEETKPFKRSSQHFGSPDSPVGELESNSLEDDEGLVLHAFQCQKRKVAHNVTMTVARSFERAYQIYQNDQFLKEVREKGSKVNKENNLEAHKNAVNIKNIIAAEETGGYLIDLGSESGPELNEIFSTKNTKDYFQTTWVSFD